jgi:hypothetical protein
MNARKKYEEVERMMKEWCNEQCNEMVDEFDKLCLKNK